MRVVDRCAADVKLAGDYGSSPPVEALDCGGGSMDVDVDVKLEEEEDSSCVKKTRPRRGRPPRTLGKASPVSSKRREDEDVCFVCFDGGSLVLCDRR